MFFGKRKGMQPRRFHYEPWFWDPKEEEFEKRVNDAKQRYHGESDKDFKPSGSFDFRRAKQEASYQTTNRFETKYTKVNPSRLLFLIVFLSALVYFVFFW